MWQHTECLKDSKLLSVDRKSYVLGERGKKKGREVKSLEVWAKKVDLGPN